MTDQTKMAKYRDVIEIQSDDHRILTSHMLDDDDDWRPVHDRPPPGEVTEPIGDLNGVMKFSSDSIIPAVQSENPHHGILPSHGLQFPPPIGAGPLPIGSMAVSAAGMTIPG